MDPEELAFARAMLAAPHDAARRLVYADWLEETGQGERAALVREAEEWLVAARYTDDEPGTGSILELFFYDSAGRPRLVVSPLRPGITTGWAPDVVAIVDKYPTDDRPSLTWYVRPDGSSWGSRNWAWLLSLAMSRGLEIPGLEITDGSR